MAAVPDPEPHRRARAAGARDTIVRCERLLGTLKAARHRQCIVVQAPAGSGKTAVLSAWRQEARCLGYDVAWLALTPAHHDVERFLSDLRNVLAALDPAVDAETRRIPAEATPGQVTECTVIALVRGIASIHTHVVLVLDDMDRVNDGSVSDALQMLLDYAPANLHIVFASRVPVPVSIARLRAQGQVLELSTRDLRFTAQESQAYLQDRLGHIDRAAAYRLHEAADGWVTGLHMLCDECLRHRRRRGQRPLSLGEVESTLLEAGRIIAPYFEAEVLSRLDDRTHGLLVMAAVCSRFCASLCARLVGRPNAVAEIASVLAAQERENLFIEPAADGGRERWYRMHPLLRETLQQRLVSFGREKLREVYESAWRWHAEHGDLEEAIRQALLADAPGVASDLMEQAIPRLHAEGRYSRIIRVMRLLPPDQVQNRIALRLWQSRMQLVSRDLQACAASIQQLESDIAHDDEANMAVLAQLRGALALNRDEVDAAVKLLPTLLSAMKANDVIMVGNLANVLSWIYMQRADYQSARDVQKEASRRMPDGAALIGTAGGTLQGQCFIGLSYAMQGDMRRAEREFREVLFHTERGGPGYAEPRYMATALLGEVLYEVNDVSEAQALLEPHLDVLERASIPDTVLRVMFVVSATHWLHGHRDAAFASLKRLESYAVRLGLARLLACSLGKQVQRYLDAGQFEKADSALVQLESIHGRHARSQGHRAHCIEIIARRARVRWLITQGHLERAAVELPALIALCETRGDQRTAAILHLQAAIVDTRRGRHDAARAKLEIALREGHRLGLVRSLLDADAGAAGLMEQLAQSNDLDPVLAFYLDRLVQAHHSTSRQMLPFMADAIRPDDPTTRNPLSGREMEIMRMIAQSVPGKKIARILGISYTTVKWHVKNAYGKLAVHTRDEAVARMRELDIDTRP